MAKETKSITIAPSEEQSTIELYEVFGWELQSSQEIFNKDSHLERSGDTINSVTTTTNYVKLVFVREKSMPNYGALVELENEYDNTPLPVRPTGKILFITGGLATAMGIITLGSFPSNLIWLLPGIGLLVWGFINRKKKMDVYEENYRIAINKRKSIIEKALDLQN